MTRRAPPAPRDLDPSPFARILDDLVVRVAGARAAVLVDFEGETVDYAGHEDPFVLRVVGAELGLLARVSTPRLGALRDLVLRGTQRSYMLRRLPDDYTLCLVMRRLSGFSRCSRALAYTCHALACEADWPRSRLEWHPVDIDIEDKRPARLRAGKRSRALEVIGSIPGPDRGFLVRTRLGWEATVVCEPGGFWYASEAP